MRPRGTRMPLQRLEASVAAAGGGCTESRTPGRPLVRSPAWRGRDRWWRIPPRSIDWGRMGRVRPSVRSPPPAIRRRISWMPTPPSSAPTSRLPTPARGSSCTAPPQRGEFARRIAWCGATVFRTTREHDVASLVASPRASRRRPARPRGTSSASGHGAGGAAPAARAAPSVRRSRASGCPAGRRPAAARRHSSAVRDDRADADTTFVRSRSSESRRAVPPARWDRRDRAVDGYVGVGFRCVTGGVGRGLPSEVRESR
ncbi:hypothetical protein SRB17_78860 [Streptomyces sp. RB17]|nr:hypothetical protein [Streptomyces sp. RB17]